MTMYFDPYARRAHLKKMLETKVHGNGPTRQRIEAEIKALEIDMGLAQGRAMEREIVRHG